jgi:superfamily I DNA/RNA helicase
MAAPLTPAALIALLKHPLTASGPAARGPHRRLTARLEAESLRGGPPEIAWGALKAWAARAGGEAPAWIAWLEATLAPLAAAAPAPLDAVLARHRDAAEALASGPGGEAHILWDKDAGTAALALFEALAADAAAFGSITAAEYRALLATLMAGRDVPEEAVVTHPGIAIWGTLEARVQRPDLAILGGLNEGIWPRLPPPDPWLSRGLRRDLGLPSPDNRIGLSAHDFQQAMAAPRIVLSRAIRDAEAPTVASRWLLRLENLLSGLGSEGQAALDAAKARGRATLAEAARLDRPETAMPAAKRPAPRPPADARPAQLSVTQIETLVRDPYAIYARHVLGLRPLEPLGRAPDALARGSALHAALEAFLAETEAGLPADAGAVLARVTDTALREAAPWPAIRLLWSARLARAAPWFLEGERTRRARARPAARERRGARALDWHAAAVHGDGQGRPHRRHALRRIRALRLQVGRRALGEGGGGLPPAASARRCDRHRRGLRGDRARAGGTHGTDRPRRAAEPGGRRRSRCGLGPAARADRHLPGDARSRLRGPAAAAAADLRERLRPSLALRRMGRRRPAGAGGCRMRLEATAAQNTAAVPDRSSWVAANAGSGKTRVLTDRVARLLLAGTEPQKILCLTYTKAAAAEMQTRLYRTLGAWAMLPEPDLRAALDALGEPGATLPRDRLDRARTLFARALETPGGLRIQTIHAFCDALLRRFPLEAGVAPNFTVLEDRRARALRAEVLDALAAGDAPELAALAVHLVGDDPDTLLREIGHTREAFAAPFAPEALAARLGIDPADDAGSIAARVLGPDGRDLLRALIPVLAGGKATDIKAAETLAAAIDAEDAGLVAVLERVLLTGTGADTPFVARTGKFPTKDLRAGHPGLMDDLDALMDRVEAGRLQRLGIAAFRRSVALNAFARRWLTALAARKAALGLIDFDDLIDRARSLLGRRETAAWVLWRLDGGIDHILVDEAQDTSPAQWRVIEAISAEFFAGLGAREGLERTIFVVGDEKQSIYSFQGAEPAAFGQMRERFGTMLDGLERALQPCDLIYSFRSAQPILALVDAVLAGPAGTQFGGPVTHHAVDPAMPGRVELWPFLEPDARADEPPWDQPLDMPAPGDPAARLADRIAATIRGWLIEGRALPGAPDGRQVRAGDVLILVQRRGAVFDAVIRALKRHAVPVAGADVLRVGGELAVRDLVAALRVAATPADDLSLAAFLRSPVGGFSERDLFALAHGRPARCGRR